MIGVLALQGAFQKHFECLQKLSQPAKLIRHPSELEDCMGLIIPGGETTAHLRLLTEPFWQALKSFGKVKPILGTCCGLILLSKEVFDNPVRTLKLMDIKVQRNAYGTQIASFEDQVVTKIDHQEVLIKGCFIRAPKIVEIGLKVRVLATHQNCVVLVENSLHIASTFHPEVSMDLTLHEYFIRKCLKLNNSVLIKHL